MKMNVRQKDDYTCWKMQVAAIHRVYLLQQRILKESGKTLNARQALLRAYEQLSDEEKIAFLLVGGAEQLLFYQQQERHQIQLM